MTARCISHDPQSAHGLVRCRRRGIFDFLRDTLTMDLISSRPCRAQARRGCALCIEGCSSSTGPMIAKSWRHHRSIASTALLALQRGRRRSGRQGALTDGSPPLIAGARQGWPHGMTQTATHGHKRGEDAGPRIMALAEIRGELASAVGAMEDPQCAHLAIDGRMRGRRRIGIHLLYQALARRTWPFGTRDGTFRERMQVYALKAARRGQAAKPAGSIPTSYEAYLKPSLCGSRFHGLGRFLNSLENVAQRGRVVGSFELAEPNQR